MSARRLHTNLLLQAGRLLLEYNESTGAIHRALMATAQALTPEPCHIVVSYREVAVSLAGEAAALEPVRHLRYNMAVQARVHATLEAVRRGTLDPSAALALFRQVEATTPHHARWLAAAILGGAAASLGGLLGADLAAAAVAAVATALGLLLRQELGRRHASPLASPLTAAFLGALLGGLAIRLGWTQTPGLVLIVPALMVVPGPHLISALLDLIDDYVPMTLSRLALATGILLASAFGVVLGVELTLPGPSLPEAGGNATSLTLTSDVVLAGIVTCGFAVFYNTPWQQLWMAMLGGMVGHGLRFVALQAGCSLEASTFLGGLTVGAIAVWMARRSRTPFAVLAFAGAVTMIPGLDLYRALGGALQLARSPAKMEIATVTPMLANGLQAALVIAALGLGLLVGARVILALTEEGGALRGSLVPRALDEATVADAPEPAATSELRECVPPDPGKH
jgi:uncharacterized membrane protein YjjP (DUF1212 family)